MPEMDFLAELAWRGMLYQQTDGAAGALARGHVSGYCGFDPTAASLHVGHLLPIMALVQLQRAGHRPVAMVGGGTGMIGDPSGKTAERTLLSREQVEANVAAMRGQLEHFLDFSGGHGAVMRDNSEWLMPLGAVEFMRDVGKHFTVNYMSAKDSVKSRMEEGISYTEFSYMLLQAYDFLQLHQRDGVMLQVGGSDQWGNMTAGVELVRRALGAEVHALTVPLLTTAAGTKFGKTEAGAVWLDAELTSPYQFYQFWMNTDDRDVGRYLRMLTVKGQPEIVDLERSVEEHPERREAQTALAAEITARVHGVGAMRIAQQVSEVLFGKFDVTSLSPDTLHALEREVPSATLSADGMFGVLDVLVRTGLVKSKGEARRLVDQGGAYVNGSRVSATTTLSEIEPLVGEYLVLRKGARDYGVVRITS